MVATLPRQFAGVLVAVFPTTQPDRVNLLVLSGPISRGNGSDGYTTSLQVTSAPG